MSKSKKVLLGIGLSLVMVLGIAYIVLYLLYPENTQTITWQVIDYICNKPLPVIGVSTLVFGAIIYKVVSFIVKNKNQKFSTILSALKNSNEELDKVKQECEELKKLIYQKEQESNEKLKLVCDAIPNKKVKAIGEQINGEETNSDTETEKI